MHVAAVLAAVLLSAAAVDLGALPPDWVGPYLQGNLLFSEVCCGVLLLFRLFVFVVSDTFQTLENVLVPEVGNGYIATVVGSSTIYASGVFNGLKYVLVDLRELNEDFDCSLRGFTYNDGRYSHSLRPFH